LLGHQHIGRGSLQLTSPDLGSIGDVDELCPQDDAIAKRLQATKQYRANP
jgi:hypothetical protein